MRKKTIPGHSLRCWPGVTAGDALWEVEASSQGMIAKAFNDDNMIGFMTTEAMMPKAFPLLRELPAGI